MATDRPLLLVHDEEEGHLVYDLLIQTDDEEEMVAATGCSPRPVARFPSPSGCRAFAVSGGAVLGAFYDFCGDTVFHDTVMQVGGYDFWERRESPRMRDAEGRLVRWWPKGRGFSIPRELSSYRDAPAMLPLSAGIVVRMDTILFDGIYGFEKLRLLPDGSWHTVTLPKPPWGTWPRTSSRSSRDLPSLAYLGDGRFCICIAYDACCFLVVELKRCSSSSSRLELAKRRKMTYMWPPQGRQSSYMGFIQPATG